MGGTVRGGWSGRLSRRGEPWEPRFGNGTSYPNSFGGVGVCVYQKTEKDNRDKQEGQKSDFEMKGAGSVDSARGLGKRGFDIITGWVGVGGVRGIKPKPERRRSRKKGGKKQPGFLEGLQVYTRSFLSPEHCSSQAKK